MFIGSIILTFILFFIGLFGISSHKNNVVIVLMAIELMLLSIILNFTIMSSYLDDFGGIIFTFFILTVAAAESAIGLALLVSYYRVRGSLTMNDYQILKG